MNPSQIFVTGTDTGVGKTVVSSLLAVGLKARYWKPVQCGTEEPTDSEELSQWIGKERIVPERFCLKAPMSPDQAAGREGVSIAVSDFEKPSQDLGPLVVEGAGGVFVPLNSQETMMDLMAFFQPSHSCCGSQWLRDTQPYFVDLGGFGKTGNPCTWTLLSRSEA